MKKFLTVLVCIIFGSIGLFIGTIALYANSSGFKHFLDKQVQRLTGTEQQAADVAYVPTVPDLSASAGNTVSAGSTEEEPLPVPVSSNGTYHASADLYLDPAGNYDAETREIVQALNDYADKVAESGRVQPAPDKALLSSPSVSYIDPDTWFSPEVRFPAAGSYCAGNLMIPYYVTTDAQYENMGGNDWELVLNAFFDAVYNYVSVREAKKYVDTSLTARVPDAGTDPETHARNTDPSIAKLLGLVDTVFTRHPECTSFDGTYMLNGVYLKDPSCVSLSVNPILLMYSSKTADADVKTDPNATYLHEAQKDELTGETILPHLETDRLSFMMTLVRDDLGDWKIAYIEE